MEEHKEARLTALETRLAHFERLAEDLSDEVARQARAMERMEILVRRLRERVVEMAEGGERPPQDDRPPPHY